MWHEWKRSIVRADRTRPHTRSFEAEKRQFNHTRMLWAGGKHRITCLLIHGNQHLRKTIYVDRLRDVARTLQRDIRKSKKHRSWTIPRTVRWTNRRGKVISRFPRVPKGQRLYALLSLGKNERTRKRSESRTHIVVGTWGLKKRPKHPPQFVEKSSTPAPAAAASTPAPAAASTPTLDPTVFQIADDKRTVAWLLAPSPEVAAKWRATLSADIVIPPSMTTVRAPHGWQIHRGGSWEDVMGTRASWAGSIDRLQQQVNPSLQIDRWGKKAMQDLAASLADSILRLSCAVRLLQTSTVSDSNHDLTLDLLDNLIVPKIFKGELAKHAVHEGRKTFVQKRDLGHSPEDVHASVEECTGLVASEGFSIYLTGVLDYIIAEVLELAENAARDQESHQEWSCANRINVSENAEEQRRACERDDACTFTPHVGDDDQGPHSGCEPSERAQVHASATPSSDTVTGKHVALGVESDAELRDLAKKTTKTESPIIMETVSCPSPNCVGVLLAHGGTESKGAAALREARGELARMLSSSLGDEDAATVQVLRMDTVYNPDRPLARFHDISTIINPTYDYYVTAEMEENMDARIQEYIRQHRIPDGDILFVGSTYESRQEYGFAIVHSNGRFSSGEEIYGSGYRGIIDMAHAHQISPQIDYSYALMEVKKFCQKSGIGCDKEWS